MSNEILDNNLKSSTSELSSSMNNLRLETVTQLETMKYRPIFNCTNDDSNSINCDSYSSYQRPQSIYSQDMVIDDTMGPSSRFHHNDHESDTAQTNNSFVPQVTTNPHTNDNGNVSSNMNQLLKSNQNHNCNVGMTNRISQFPTDPFQLSSDPSSLIRIVVHGRNYREPRSSSKRCNQCFEVFGLFRKKHYCLICCKLYCNDCCRNHYYINILGKRTKRLCKQCYNNLLRLGFNVTLTNTKLDNNIDDHCLENVQYVSIPKLSAPPMYTKENTPIETTNDPPPRYITFSGIPDCVTFCHRYYGLNMEESVANYMNNNLKLPPIIVNDKKKLKMKNILKEESSIKQLDENGKVVFILNRYLIMKVYKKRINLDEYYVFVTDGMHKVCTDNLYVVIKYNGSRKVHFMKFISLIMSEIFERALKKNRLVEFKYYSIENSSPHLLANEVKYCGYIPVRYYGKDNEFNFENVNIFQYFSLVFLFEAEVNLVKVLPLIVLAQIGLQSHDSPRLLTNDTDRQTVDYHSLDYHVQCYQGVCERVKFNSDVGFSIELHGQTAILIMNEEARKHMHIILSDLKREEVICIGTILSDISNGILLPPRENDPHLIHHFSCSNNITFPNVYAMCFLSLSLKNTLNIQNDTSWINHPSKTISKLFHSGLYIHLSLDDYDSLVHHFKTNNESQEFILPLQTVENNYKTVLHYDITRIIFREISTELELMKCDFISPVDGRPYTQFPLIKGWRKYEFYEYSPSVRLVWLFSVVVAKSAQQKLNSLGSQNVKFLTRCIINVSRAIIKAFTRENKVLNLCSQGYDLIATRVTHENEIIENIDKELTMVFYSGGNIIGYENFYAESLRNNVKYIKKYLGELKECALDIIFQISQIV